MTTRTTRHTSERGAVSLFAVIFAMLLISVVTISFLRIMVNDQAQSTGNDLSRSAYDSSLAGVEDAKRALVWYSQQCAAGAAAGACADATATINSSTCNKAIVEVVKSGDIASTNGGAAGAVGEVKVQQSQADASGDNADAALDQAYTCVTMQLDTDDYVNVIPKDTAIMVPLIGEGGFNRVTLEWFSRDDVSNKTGAVSLAAASQRLPKPTEWPVTRPSLLRAQFMQATNNFTLGDYDANSNDGKSNTNTVFLYPTSTANTGDIVLVDRDSRSATPAPAAPASAPKTVSCVSTIPSGGYSCKAELVVPSPRNGTRNAAYLRVSAFYTATHVRVTLRNGTASATATPVKFKGVQPIVDSTGRASNVFRRVQSRVDLYDTTFPYPDAAVETSGDFCKDFGVTNDAYIAGSCETTK